MNDTSSQRPSRAHEAPEGIAARRVTAAFLLTFCLGGALAAGAYLLLRTRQERARPAGQFTEANLTLRERVSEVLQQPYDVAHPIPDAKQRAADALEHFGWVDRQRAIIRIPVSRAMQWMAARHTTALDGGGTAP